jgi:cytochrome c biogenesis protein CcmG, thiol:disulfide interchange protein DsbE
MRCGTQAHPRRVLDPGSPRRRLLGLGMGIICLGAAGRPAAAQDRPPIIDNPAPTLALTELGGGTIDLATLRGRPVIVNFWATWCGPCRDEMPLLAARWRAHQSAGLEVLAVNSTDQERGKDVRRFVERLALPFPILLDERGRMRERYALTTLPTTVFVDSAGVVRAVHAGALSPEQLDRALTLILPSPDSAGH